MENASKALLIAAAVLIVILLIAFGMRIMNSAGDASTSATSTGQELSNQTTSAATAAQGALKDASKWGE